MTACWPAAAEQRRPPRSPVKAAYTLAGSIHTISEDCPHRAVSLHAVRLPKIVVPELTICAKRRAHDCTLRAASMEAACACAASLSQTSHSGLQFLNILARKNRTLHSVHLETSIGSAFSPVLMFLKYKARVLLMSASPLFHPCVCADLMRVILASGGLIDARRYGGPPGAWPWLYRRRPWRS